MSGLQNWLAPISHLLFANRNIVIVLLCAVVFWAAIQALLNRWRADRLEHELRTARTGGGSAAYGRRYATAAPVEDGPGEGGGALPPVKGGRTYARNLGSALQKAGMSSPQIYSPPTPAGWSPNTTPTPPPAQPGMASPYAAPTAPWQGAPGPAAPWAFPAAGRQPAPGGPPSAAPFYQSQPAATPGNPGSAPQAAPPPAPIYSPAAPTPGPFVPPMSAPFGQSGAPAPSSGPAAPVYSPPPGAPPLMTPPPIAMPTPEAAGDAGRRGKPKRRRFNFNVLENLEKMVQSKPAEPAPTGGWSPPAAPAVPPTPPQGNLPALPVPTTAAPAPSVVPNQPAGKGLGTSGPATASIPSEPAVAEPTLDFSNAPAAETPSEPVEADDEGPAPAEAEHIEESEPPVKPQSRSSMRSMMFGEEPPAGKAASQPAAEEASTEEPSSAEMTPSAEPATVEPESPWPSYPWQQRQEADSSASAEPSSTEDRHDAVQPTDESKSAADAAKSDGYDPWKSTTSVEPDAWTTTREGESETAGTPSAEEAQPTAVDASESVSPRAPESTASDSDRPGAGTLVIIEDDQTAASYYATLFRGNGYQVEVANDGVSGVDLCARVQPQVILLDVMMPRQNGILVLQTLRASDETKNTPVVVMSNFSEPTLIKRALQLGALEYVIKTQVEGPALLNALPRWMNREKAFAAA